MDVFEKKERNWLLASILIYILCVLSYAVWDDIQTKKTVLQNIDERLTLAAGALKYMLAPDFHDRAVDNDSISFEEELKNREAFSTYSFQNGFAWIYTLAEQNGKFFFSAPSVSEEEAKERKSWYWLPYEDIPDDFVRAFNENETVFSTYTDQWGTFRSIAKPEFSPGGRKYLACVDYDISYIKTLLKKNVYKSVVTALLFLLFSLPFLLAFRHGYKAFSKVMIEKNKELEVHKNNLEIEVANRTAELREAKEESDTLVDDLEQALEEVKTLQGFLPICAQCKKIRDDAGYWQELEKFIEERSDAAFSHSICPDCIKLLYPDYAEKFLKGSKKDP